MKRRIKEFQQLSTDELINEIKERDLIIDGEERIGMSSYSLRVAEYINKRVSEDKRVL